MADGPLRRWRVLVIDDDDKILRTYARVLRGTSDVVGAATAEAALERLDAGERFDAILCDYQLGSGMDGVAFLDQARAIDAAQWRRTALVAGAVPSDADARRLPRPPLAKPLAAEELQAIVEELGREASSSGKKP